MLPKDISEDQYRTTYTVLSALITNSIISQKLKDARESANRDWIVGLKTVRNGGSTTAIYEVSRRWGNKVLYGFQTLEQGKRFAESFKIPKRKIFSIGQIKNGSLRGINSIAAIFFDEFSSLKSIEQEELIDYANAATANSPIRCLALIN